ncbi:MAG: ribosome biogenesis GTPase Der [Dehalococcoidia bacterium]|jgi:GTP-binding protein|nr:ribosome biogenesis GTPase Der [Dehalococcoidia bacterium]
MSRPVVALVGRTNVGKSTLLNRLAGERLVVVDDQPHVTRDRVFAPVTWADRDMLFVDTGGWTPVAESSLGLKVKHQAELALERADVVVLVASATDGVIASDEEVVGLVRAAGKATILAVNKVDTDRRDPLLADFHRLGIERVIAVSAIHDRGIDELMDAVVSLLPPAEPPAPVATGVLRLAIVGRPNAGKSTLLNAFLGEERAIVDETPGTTRDSLDAELAWKGRRLILVDTAGIRRRSQLGYGVDYFSVLRSMQAIDRCDVAILVLDAIEPATAQDNSIARYVFESGKGLVLVVNKWDLVPAAEREAHKERLKQRLDFLTHVPLLHISAKNNRNTTEVLMRAVEVADARMLHLAPDVVDTAIKEAVERYAPPRLGTRTLSVARASQDASRPWVFIIRVNDLRLVLKTYLRYLEHQLRNQFGFDGVPIHFVVVKAGRPSSGKGGKKTR